MATATNGLGEFLDRESLAGSAFYRVREPERGTAATEMERGHSCPLKGVV